VAGGRSFRQADAGAFHTCAVTTNDRAFCWGNGRLGQLGNGKTYLSFWPRRVAGGLDFARVTSGGAHACGETTSNRVYCWGSNGSGNLGEGTTTTRLTPVAVTGGLFFRQVSAGDSHTCGKTTADVAYCWGNNEWGQLGRWHDHRPAAANTGRWSVIESRTGRADGASISIPVADNGMTRQVDIALRSHRRRKWFLKRGARIRARLDAERVRKSRVGREACAGTRGTGLSAL
jgi:alpha-tubulin suppressor-like RCC1 family protein